ncbi:hypothetical protein [Methanosarcina sp.]|uniref:hypothetical protein n=1 Tax=Methanosarcina sp. TaxID=2213 RepID=UPI003C77478B
MLIPANYEKLEKNLLVIGADVIALLKKDTYNIEDLFIKMKDKKSIGLEQYYDVLTFLWLAEIIELYGYHIRLKRAPCT